MWYNKKTLKISYVEKKAKNEFSGKWFLIGVASECNFLKTNNYKVQATSMVITQPKEEKKVSVSTFRKLDGICWEIRQEYQKSKSDGRFLLKGRGYRNYVDVVVGETDYNSYAILYYGKQRTISLKLYGRQEDIGNDIIFKFEKYAVDQNIQEDFVYYFPKYGFCESADEFHILNEVKN
ncbi:complement component C8 gamma chain [Latimeria chalumnae]|uniref:complement component C8 gamma chain n=1 Tax=Latimeria chalumnae TaxID=7897 RepID=UPI00313C071A